MKRIQADFSRREAATLLAALRFWSEEMPRHGARIARPYFRAAGFPRVKPLSSAEIDELSKRLRASFQK